MTTSVPKNAKSVNFKYAMNLMQLIELFPDEASCRRYLEALRWPDAVLKCAGNAKEGLELVEQEWPNIVLLHPTPQETPLSEVIQELRSFSNVPLMVLGNKGNDMEVVTSLELGADDYVRLPCDLTELTTRIWALLRRASGTATPA